MALPDHLVDGLRAHEVCQWSVHQVLAPSLVDDKTDEITDTFIIIFVTELFKKKTKITFDNQKTRDYNKNRNCGKKESR